MEAVLGIIVVYCIVKLLFGNNKKQPREDREKQTIFKYPEGGYGLDDDPVMDELFFLDIMEDDD